MGTKKSALKKTTAATISKSKVVKSVAKPVKAVKVAAKRATSKQSKQQQLHDQMVRTRFVAVAVVITAALLAILIGLMGYRRGTDAVTQVTDSQGVLFLQKTSSDGTQAGATFTVDVYENSGRQSVNALQASINYPANLLEVATIKPSGSFPQEAATDTRTAGLIRIARAVNVQSASTQGSRPVATIDFKVKSDISGPVTLTIDNATSLLVRSSDSQNILSQTGTSTFKF